MRLSDGRLILSPSDLMRFQGCQHASALDLEYLRGRAITPADDAPDAVLTQRKGQEHESRYLAKLRERKSGVASIGRNTDFSKAVEQTRTAMAAGAPAIFQGAVEAGRWQGYSDFLERVEVRSGLGNYGYEVVDTKLKRRADPRHAIQVSL
jgi:predicted RecB family nuclease